MTMKKLVLIMIAALVAYVPMCGQTRSEQNAAHKDAVAAAKELRRAGLSEWPRTA